ncbi:MAG: hypothetical protein JO303_03775 [Caulobacteraceae bacterium]|nr:hypothetical protein [Caulobacteraceae bacterium]
MKPSFLGVTLAAATALSASSALAQSLNDQAYGPGQPTPSYAAPSATDQMNQAYDDQQQTYQQQQQTYQAQQDAYHRAREHYRDQKAAYAERRDVYLHDRDAYDAEYGSGAFIRYWRDHPGEYDERYGPGAYEHDFGVPAAYEGDQ